jgi:hypothetical protein
MTIDQKLVCTNIREDAPPNAFCYLTTASKNRIEVHKQTLTVESTLTESCNPVIVWQALYMFGDYIIKLQACREEPFPQITPGTLIWHYY